MYRRPILLLLGLAMLVFLAVRYQTDTPMESGQQQSFKDKFYLENFTAQSFNQSGSLDRVLEGSRLNQPTDTLDNHITKPVLVIMEDQSPKWKLVANSGWMNNEHTLAQLDDHLKLTEMKDTQFQMDTNHMTMELLTRKLLTGDRVILTQSSGVTEGTGMEADLNTSRFELKTQVESVYEP